MPPAKPHAPRKAPEPHRPTSKNPLEVVDPRWLLKALALTLVAALACVYATLCLLVYQGAWQLVLSPVRAITSTPASAGLAYSDVHFDASETGQPRLTGWWLPAQSSQPSTALQFTPKYAAYTILYLHGGNGSLSDTVPELARLHHAGLNIFAIDYRGYGANDPAVHPSDDRMVQDAAAALDYLISTQHISARNIIPYGSGLGASLAASLAHDHPELPAIILDNPDPDPAVTAATTHRSHLLPIRLLFGNRFAIATPLATLATPKLLIAGGPNVPAATDLPRIQTLFEHSASPRFTLTLPPSNSDDAYQAALTRFLDQYLPAH